MMKRKIIPATHASILLGLLFLLTPVHAEEARQLEATEPCSHCSCVSSEKSAEETNSVSAALQSRREMMDRLLNMSSEELSRVRGLVERLEEMNQEERDGLRRRATIFHEVSEEERQSREERWENLSPEEREHIHQKVREREERWKRMSPEEREQATQERQRRQGPPPGPGR